MTKAVNKFLQKAKVKEGRLHRTLRVPQGYNMGEMMTFLQKIEATPVGHVCKNPLAHGVRQIKVDAHLKRMVGFAIRGIKASRGEYRK